MMTSQYYLHLSSTDDISRYPSNTGADFRVSLRPEINIPDNESWSGAVTELVVSPSIADEFMLCSDIVQ